MCGITGILFPEPSPTGELIHRMTDALRHRGPDGDGFVALDDSAAPVAAADVRNATGRVFLGHRRLAIIDLDGSRQPLANEDGAVWVTFNGEIYNFVDLREQLEARGHVLREAGDTEVLVHLWEEHGADMVDHLVGMFALAIYDARTRTLFLARDRFGQKPLFYWTRDDGLFAFASELQALWTLPGFPQELDEHAAALYFRYGYVPAPQTIYRGVFSLPPGCRLLSKPEAPLKVDAYWRPRVRGTQSADLDELEALLDDAVAKRMISDVPLGAFLSGGVDSALITASMAKHANEPVRTFTISTKSHFDESEAAAATAAHLGTDHQVFTVDPDLVEIAEKLARHYGQPFADYSSVPTYYVSRETRRHVTVALAGDGGDELFGGYERYLNSAWTLRLARIPAPLRGLLATSLETAMPKTPWWSARINFLRSACGLRDKGENASQAFHGHWQKRLFLPEFAARLREDEARAQGEFRRLWDEAESDEPMERWFEVDQRLYMPNAVLTKVDVASMAVSLECRAPMLDHRFAELANRVLLSDKLRGRSSSESKWALRRLSERRVPREIADLPKKGFTLPMSDWLRGDLADWAQATLFDEGAGGPDDWRAFLREDVVRRMWSDHRAGRADQGPRLWMLIAWGLWRRSR